MRKLIVIIGFVALVGIAVVISMLGSSGNASTPQPTVQPTAVVVKAKTEKSVVSEARVVPVTTASLGLAAGGRISQVLVKEGDRVEANQVLVRLDSRQQAAAVAQAEAALKGAQSRFDELKAGARPQEIAAAEAGLAGAQARFDELKTGARPQEIAAAEAGLAGAQAALQRLQQGPDEQQLIAARADLANAEAALKQAQSAYDRAGGANNPDVGRLPTSLALEQAINSANAAQARLASLQSGPRAADLAAARADIQRAQAQLDLIKAGTRPETLAAARADLQRAQVQLDLIKAGARPETLAAAESEVTSARAALEQAKIALANTELRAPFAGLIASLDAKVGEQVGAGVPILRLADCSAWQIETTDLTELNIARVREGDAVTITFDALPGLELPGTITRIRMFGENKQGDIVYTVLVKPSQNDERLRWNMTAKVTMAPK